MMETLDFDVFGLILKCLVSVLVFFFQRIRNRFLVRGLIQDRSIPQELLSRAKGLAFLTVIKGCVPAWGVV